MKIRERKYTGTEDAEVKDWELIHRKLAKRAAASGMVLLKNEEHMLPIANTEKLALYGPGAVFTVKGGTGSGDVNARETVSIYEGLQKAGYLITTDNWLQDYKEKYRKARQAWRQEIWDKAAKDTERGGLGVFFAYSSTPFRAPVGEMPIKTEADTALFVISRVAGEGKDRALEEGDYYISKEEESFLSALCRQYQRVVLILNTGGIIDLGFADRYENIKAVIYMQQPGMEAGSALADILCGKAVPDAKLTDSWAYDYKDYPNADTFSYRNQDVEQEEYSEGIFVGYRYFDTYEIPVRYSFGYGLSYTSFDVEYQRVKMKKSADGEKRLLAEVLVTNTGDTFTAREVVQLYISAPQTRRAKEYRRLVGFQKTGFLKPGEAEILQIPVSIDALGYYEEEESGWLLERGSYGLFVGNSLESSEIVACIEAEEDVLLCKTEHICPLKSELHELQGNKERTEARRAEWTEKYKAPAVIIQSRDVKTESYDYTPAYRDMPKEVCDFVDKLTTEQLILLATGNVGKAQGAALGSAGISVPGSAAETSDCAQAGGLAPIVLADGPAGLRLSQSYLIKKDRIVPSPLEMAMENGFLCKERPVKDADSIERFQYCTAFPVGTSLAQSWDLCLLEEIGRAVAEEMKRYDITLWLAPGMNIHRNPLCGRNFEYFSEDPLVSGRMAAAITRGVQSQEGYGTTIKHFACNNQEDNRMASDSIVGERALREIYLRGFELAVKEAEPMAIMTSYNRVNGVHAANSYDLCTKVVRNEWNYKGLIMTDWTTTMQGDDCTAAGCMRAGNDIVMPGSEADHENIREQLKSGQLTGGELKRSVARLVNTVWKADVYEKI